jgi:hypothetical protein
MEYIENNTQTYTNDANDKIKIILRQTNYTECEAKEKLILYNYDHIKVIKSYFGIEEKKEKPIKSINQEIYKQIRFKLDADMREYTKMKEQS